MQGALLFALLLSSSELELRPSLSLQLGYDSNAKRVYASVPGEGESELLPAEDAELPVVVGEGFLRASGVVKGSASFLELDAGFDGALGTTLFFDRRRLPDKDYAGDYPTFRAATRTDEERMVVGEGRGFLERALPLGFRGRLQTELKARVQQNGLRSYGFERSELRLSRAIVDGVYARGALLGQVFHAADAPQYLHFGGGVDGGVSWRISARESFDVGGGVVTLAYPFGRIDVADPSLRRLDLPLHLALVVTSARRVFVSGGYVLLYNLTNARGEPYVRHRVFGVLGFKLPLDVNVAAQGSLQLSYYPEGISLSQQYLLNVEDENQNKLAVLVTRPFLGGLHLEAQLAWFARELAGEGLRGLRTLAVVGVRAEL